MKQKISIPIAGMFVTFEMEDDRITVPLNRVADRLDDLRRFWREYWAPEWFLHIQKNFTGEGRYVGGWRALSPAYAEWKRKHFGKKPILVATGAMKQSLVMGEPNNVLNMSARRVQAGSRDRKVRYHNVGTARMPRRRILVKLPNDTTSRLMVRYLRDEMQAAGMRATA